MQTRRTFLKSTGTAVALAPFVSQAENKPADAMPLPWYRRTVRWGQTNITEADPARYDVEWWRGYWKRTHVQGVIINAGGIVAYYPSKYPLHYRPKALGDRDLYGELAAAAHGDGLVVFARMDSNRAHKEFFDTHPDWFARHQDGAPYRAGEHFVTCINSPYYDEYLPGILHEIIERSHADGITDNSWAGLGRGSICYCDNCKRRFRDYGGIDIPREKNWDDANYRKWIEWNYARRIDVWELNNRTTRAAGGRDCIWSGMNTGSISGQSASFRDYREICRRAEIIMLDHQSRGEAGFQENAAMGKLLHGLLGWDKLIPESMAMYQAGRPTFRVASKPPLEARLWMVEGIAGGIQPWWHHVGAYHDDRRMYNTAEPIMAWHEKHQQYLVNRTPVANVGLVWSQRNTDFYGRDSADDLVELPWRGWTNALVKSRIPFLPVHIDDIDQQKWTVLVLPNLAALSDAQLDKLRTFVNRGGSLIATGDATRATEHGDPRPDFGLAEIFGAHVADPKLDRRSASTSHSYLRLLPELRASVNGPRTGSEPTPNGTRHPVLRVFEQTDLLPFGGSLQPLKIDSPDSVLATFVPPFPIYPPETAWMREPKTDIAAIIARELPGRARIVFMPADIDRRYARDNLPDQKQLLENAVRWAARDELPFEVSGPGFLDCNLYRQKDRLVLHLVNLTTSGQTPVEEIIPVGPLRVTLRRRVSSIVHRAEALVSRKRLHVVKRESSCEFLIENIGLHEVVVVGG